MDHGLSEFKQEMGKKNETFDQRINN